MFITTIINLRGLPRDTLYSSSTPDLALSGLAFPIVQIITGQNGV